MQTFTVSSAWNKGNRRRLHVGFQNAALCFVPARQFTSYVLKNFAKFVVPAIYFLRILTLLVLFCYHLFGVKMPCWTAFLILPSIKGHSVPKPMRNPRQILRGPYIFIMSTIQSTSILAIANQRQLLMSSCHLSKTSLQTLIIITDRLSIQVCVLASWKQDKNTSLFLWTCFFCSVGWPTRVCSTQHGSYSWSGF